MSVFKCMKTVSHRAHRGHREITMSSVRSVCSVATTKHKPRRSSLPAQLLLCGRNYLVRLEPELPLQFLEWRRSPERAHADHLTGGTEIPLPPQSGGLLDGDARRHVRRQHAVPVLLRLLVEDLP